MKPAIKLEPADTASFRQLVSEAYRTGQAQAKAETEEEQKGHSSYYSRLLNEADQKGQILANEVFEAGRLSRAIDRDQL